MPNVGTYAILRIISLQSNLINMNTNDDKIPMLEDQKRFLVFVFEPSTSVVSTETTTIINLPKMTVSTYSLGSILFTKKFQNMHRKVEF